MYNIFTATLIIYTTPVVPFITFIINLSSTCYNMKRYKLIKLNRFFYERNLKKKKNVKTKLLIFNLYVLIH